MRNKAGNRKYRLFYYFTPMFPSRKIGFFVIAAVFAVWGVYCYNPFLQWFQNDDFSHILLSKQGVFFQKNSFRPVCDLSMMMDYYLWKQYAPGYHLTNLLLHAICSCLAYLFAKRVFSMHNLCKPFYAAGCGLLFFVYPFHGEAVFWILGRSAVLGAIFSLAFLLVFLAKQKSALTSVIYSSLFAVALLTYESTWVLPIVAFMLQKNEPGDGFKNRLERYLPLAAIFAVYLFGRFMVINEIVGAYEGVNFLHFNAGVLLANYGKLFAMGFVAYTETHVALTIAFIVMSAILLFAAVKQSFPLVLTLLVCLLIALLPYLSLGIDTHGTEGERFLYLPSVFVVMLVVMIIGSIQKAQTKFTVAALVSTLYAMQLYVTALNYRFAGSVVKQTVSQIETSAAGTNIFIEGLPKGQHGALILASGLPEAGELFGNGRNASIHILSWRYELNPLQVPYKTVVYAAKPGEEGVKYVFTDSALLIYK